VLLLGRRAGWREYAARKLLGRRACHFRFIPSFKFNFFRPLFLRRLSEFQPDVVHLVDPVILARRPGGGTRAGASADFVLSTNLAAYCNISAFICSPSHVVL